jgi:DNA-binding NarL/FixJ family response regulator
MNTNKTVNIMRPVILADNQDISKVGLSCLIISNGLSDTVVAAKSMKELQDSLTIYPDAIVVLDYTLFDFVSTQQMLIVKAAHRNSLWILFSYDLSASFLREVLFSDTDISAIMKYAPKDEIITVLQNAVNNKVYLCEYVEQVLSDNIPSQTTTVILTASEKTILREIALGKATKEIAYEKNLSFHTVNTHRKNIFRKLDINNVHEAIKYAFRAGLIDVTEYCI